MKRSGLALVMCAVLAFVSACGEEAASERDEKRASADTETTEAPQDVEVTLSVTRPSDDETVRGRSVVVLGSAAPPDAEVTINGDAVETQSDGSFEERVALPDFGENVLSVKASRGSDSDRETIYVTRERTARERAALRKRQREARERRLASLRADAKAIDPKQLQKNPDRYAEERIVISGEIFQIQEGGENFFLMNTLCDSEFGIRLCEGPEVYVSYDISTNATEESFVTVYGVVEGGYEYETQIGGSNYVAHVKAEIIEVSG